MKHFYLFIVILAIGACSTENTYGPFKLKEGQEVELLVSHRYGAIDDTPLLLPQNQPPGFPLSPFDREPGYNYKVKAKMVPYNGPAIMDGGPSDVLQYVKTISKEKYQGNESFMLDLIRNPGFGTPIIVLFKESGKYWFGFGSDKTQLTYNNSDIESKLEEIWQHFEEIKRGYQAGQTRVGLKWKSIRATVTHDPADFGKAYRLSKIEFSE